MFEYVIHILIHKREIARDYCSRGDIKLEGTERKGNIDMWKKHDYNEYIISE